MHNRPRIAVRHILSFALAIGACSSDGPTGDRQAPTVTANTPTTAATGVARSTAVTVTFSEPVAPGSVSASSFTVTPAGGAAIAGAVTVNGATATFTPSAALAFGTAYTARVTTSVTDIAGNALAAAHSWTFTTITNPAPTVASTSPASAATGIARTATVSATFSEPVAPATATTTTFTVTPAGGTAIAGSVAVNGAVVTFTPTTQLAFGTTYTARLTTGITDLDGAQLAADHSWTFSTVANVAPAANAGPSQDVNRGATVQLAGTATDTENEALTYRWTQTYGPDVTAGAGFLTGASPSFTAPSTVSSVRFDLVVTDASGGSSQASVVQVNVMEDRTRAIYVSPLGNDLNAGTSRAQPVLTLTAAIARATALGGGADVYAVNGTYAESVALANGVSIYGGYQSATWLRNPNDFQTTIQGGASGMGVSAFGVSQVTVDGFSIRTPMTTSTIGQSLYGVSIHLSSDITISNNRITAGDAGAGGAGLAGQQGVDGFAGGAGGNAVCTGATPIAGAAGTAGQPGPDDSGADMGYPGGSGGAGGGSVEPGQSGSPGVGFAGSSGGAGGSATGGNGENGTGGGGVLSGQNGRAADAFGFASDGAYTAALGAFGTGGYTPTSASGGGGGGGGTGAGGGGGGGGASGGGASAGTRGTGAGGSFAIIVTSSLRIVVTNNTLITGKGGNGGAGGTGGRGGIGGLGGVGGAGCGGGGAGGRGGNGESGGNGGHGGASAGGPSIGILEDAASTVTSANNSYQIGAAGAGGTSLGNSAPAGIAAESRK